MATVITDGRFNKSNVRSSLSTFSCDASSSVLLQCNSTMKGSSCYISVSKCSTEVGLRCHSKLILLIISYYLKTIFINCWYFADSVTGSCTDGQTRLVNGTLAQEGRVEVCLNGIWGSICQSGFGQDDAYVICKELGYNGPCKYSRGNMMLSCDY